ncbi:MAG TPA: GTP-binding protein [Gaiellaceae bacterium]|nr:GTP-binding protein [Gaiellaceae bacterium]
MPATSSERAVELVRLATAGSVDDGKSTLIGRLLHDAKAILADTYDDLHGRDGELDLARLTDGLRAEREQGITIDVAYRYFATGARRFVLADCPGHVQYTRNMVTGASTADVLVLLVDARSGVVEQTRRHLAVGALLGLRHVVVCVNKMDLVGWAEERFDAIARDADEVWRRVGGRGEVTYVPVSALRGDNVVDRSEEMPWYGGVALLEHLEGLRLAGERTGAPARFPVQTVIRHGDFRGFAGRVESGVLRAGDEVVVLPSGVRSRVAAIDTYDGPLEAAEAGRSVTVLLADDVDVSRGDLLAPVAEAPEPVRALAADVCWMSAVPLRPRARLLVRWTTATVPAIVDAVEHRLDVETLDRADATTELALNDIGRVRLRLARPLPVDRYDDVRATGAFVLVDEATNETVGAGMVR